jgi:hypothetical protein
MMPTGHMRMRPILQTGLVRHMIPEDIFTSHNGQLMGVHQVSDMGLLTHTMVIASLSWITTGIERPMMMR